MLLVHKEKEFVGRLVDSVDTMSRVLLIIPDIQDQHMNGSSAARSATCIDWHVLDVLVQCAEDVGSIPIQQLKGRLFPNYRVKARIFKIEFGSS